ncbi:phenylacetate--CoA ligase family protein [Streptomyces sp. bgisy034]|uniref:phenylacetate--CoA ligase family protein n=1 Tax=Streptomyces sp. bgisy034 TaxID=3413774 RepID=UPI003EB989D3
MFTLYDDEAASVGRGIIRRQRDFAAGRWSEERLAAHQLDAFRATLDHVREHSPFYRRHLADAPTHLASLSAEDLAAFPFTLKDDLRAAQQDVLSRPLSKAWIFYETTGTTGAVTPCPRDNTDSLHNNAVLTSHYETILRPYGEDQFIGVCGPTEMHAFGDTFGEVCRNLGLAVAKMWPHSPMVGFDRALAAIREIPLTALFCTPGMALTLAKKAVAAGLDPARDLPVQVLMLTGELASPALLAAVGDLWGARAYNALYGSQEASALGAAAADGSLYAMPVINHYEVIDPAGDAPVEPDAEGVLLGELVVTSLYQGLKPLVRYRTGDLVRMRAAAPGRTLPAPVLEVLGRTRDELNVGGHRITGYDLENLLLAPFGGYLDYQVVLDSGDDGTDRLTLRFETQDGAAPRTDEMALAAVRERLGVALDVELGTMGSVTGTGAMVSWKAARVVDRRTGRRDAESAAALALAVARS